MISTPKRVSVTFEITTEQLHKATGLALQKGCTTVDVFREIVERDLDAVVMPTSETASENPPSSK